jgi:hypothetical protein
METVKVKKDELHTQLKQNRDKHKATFEEANANYRQKVIDSLRSRADEIEAGAEINTIFLLPKPEDHTEDYDEAISSLEWHQGDEVELERSVEFRQWVLDKWRWEISFLSNTTSYTAAARR